MLRYSQSLKEPVPKKPEPKPFEEFKKKAIPIKSDFGQSPSVPRDQLSLPETSQGKF